MRPIEVATAFYDAGIYVLPAGLKKKAPMVPWKEWQDGFPREKLEEWFGHLEKCNYWLICGTDGGVICLDNDSEKAQEYWAERLGPILEQTTTSKTSQGYHYMFGLKPGEKFQSFSVHKDGLDYDVRGRGGGVIIPPSVHQSGHVYRWIRDLSFLQPVPTELRSEGSRAAEDAGVQGKGQEDGGRGISGLAELLSVLPSEGGRNEWLTRVCGHYAKMHPFRDGYEASILTAAAMLPVPLKEAEIRKTADSIWEAEHRKVSLGKFEESAGFLRGDGQKLFTQVKAKDGPYEERPWSNFDVVARGVIIDDGDTRTYDVLIHREGHTPIAGMLPGATLGSSINTSNWLAARGANIIPPGNDLHRSQPSLRLQRYIESQDPPKHVAAHYLGWHPDEGWICHEGVITKDGLRAHDVTVPSQLLLDRAPYVYPFSSEHEARAALREVLTFHEEVVVGVFGAWWASCFLKWHLTKMTALFPLMVLEAPSETGKTNGFFNMMMQLSGFNGGQGVYTEAALRDALGAHMNGIVWMDDPTTVSRFWEELRQSTSGGSRTKKGQDNTEQVTIHMVAPIVLSGEGFAAIRNEKALGDRSVVLPVTSPTERMSLRDPTRPQWDDVVDLMNAQGGSLTKHAGTLVQMALSNVDLVKQVRSLRVGVGRLADKNAILRVGARLLAAMSGEDKWISVVDEWVENLDSGDRRDNSLILQILPETLLNDGVPRKPGMGVPVFVDENAIVWFSTPLLAHRWEHGRHTDREKQLGSANSILQQRKMLGIEGLGKVFTLQDNRNIGGGMKQSRFHCLDAKQSAKLLATHGILLSDNGDQFITGISTAASPSAKTLSFELRADGEEPC